MRLFAAFVPPPEVLEELTEVVGSVSVAAPEPAAARGLFRRRPRRGDGPDPARPAGPELHRPPIEELHIPITSFGNVTLGDSVKLAGALRTAAASWPRPEVSFAGAAALEFPGDESVWARLSGDLDGVAQVGRGLPQVVQRLGFLVDRRVFRPWLSVGTITEQTTAPYLEKVVEALEQFQGRPWTVEHVHLLRRPADLNDTHSFEVLEELPLGQVEDPASAGG